MAQMIGPVARLKARAVEPTNVARRVVSWAMPMAQAALATTVEVQVEAAAAGAPWRLVALLTLRQTSVTVGAPLRWCARSARSAQQSPESGGKAIVVEGVQVLGLGRATGRHRQLAAMEALVMGAIRTASAAPMPTLARAALRAGPRKRAWLAVMPTTAAVAAAAVAPVAKDRS